METEKFVRKTQAVSTLTYWTKIFFILTIFFSISYIVYGVTTQVGLHPEILTDDTKLVMLILYLLSNVASNYMYLFSVCIGLWLVLGLINIFI